MALPTADTMNYEVMYYTNKLKILHRAIEILGSIYMYIQQPNINGSPGMITSPGPKILSFYWMDMTAVPPKYHIKSTITRNY